MINITFPDYKKSPFYKECPEGYEAGYYIKLYTEDDEPILYEQPYIKFDDLKDSLKWSKEERSSYVEEKGDYSYNLSTAIGNKLTICEYWNDTKGNYFYGPESEPIVLEGGYTKQWVLTKTESFNFDHNNDDSLYNAMANGNIFKVFYSKLVDDGNGGHVEIASAKATVTFSKLPSVIKTGQSIDIGCEKDIKITGDISLELSPNVNDIEIKTKQSLEYPFEKSYFPYEYEMVSYYIIDGKSVEVHQPNNIDITYECGGAKTVYHYELQPIKQ